MNYHHACPYLNFASPQPLSRGRGVKSLIYKQIPPSLLGEGGEGDEVFMLYCTMVISSTRCFAPE